MGWQHWQQKTTYITTHISICVRVCGDPAHWSRAKQVEPAFMPELKPELKPESVSKNQPHPPAVVIDRGLVRWWILVRVCVVKYAMTYKS